MTYHIWPM